MQIETTPTEAPVDAMALDTADFDIFSSLDDLTVETKVTPQEKPLNDEATQDVEDDVVEDENDFDDGESSFDFDEIEDTEFDENGHEVESEDEEAEEESEEADESDEPEDADAEEAEVDTEEEEEVEYETYMVNLPDGTEINLAKAVQGYRDAEALKTERQEFEDSRTSFQTEAKDVIKYMELAKLESDRVLEDYKDFDWSTLAKEDPQAYVENKEFLERYTRRRKEIGTAMEEMQEANTAKSKAEFKEKAQSCVSTLKADIPGWNDTVYQDLIAYAVENGTAESEILECVDPVIFKLLHKAHQFDKGKQVVKAKVKRAVKSPRKVVKSSPKAVIKPQSNTAKLEGLMSQGNTSDSDLFNALED